MKEISNCLSCWVLTMATDDGISMYTNESDSFPEEMDEAAMSTALLMSMGGGSEHDNNGTNVTEEHFDRPQVMSSKHDRLAFDGQDCDVRPLEYTTEQLLFIVADDDNVLDVSGHW